MNTDEPIDARFSSWLKEHRGIMHKIARAYTAEPADQADLFQEMALQLWRSIPAFRGQAADSTWIYRVCLNTAMTWRRGSMRRERDLVPGADLGRVSAESASPAEDAGQRDLLEKLYAAIQTMPDFDRALILMTLDGLAYREMAEVTGLTENHVGVALTRARKRLAELMKGVTDELE
ncbi:MAG: sigma-70 family RNA polymerase sigma factor [Verrucomicrobia bacterium]|nr:sigma-70 family RNA polymerase sigma factor [Verrucomicrobiota bacterium]